MTVTIFWFLAFVSTAGAYDGTVVSRAVGATVTASTIRKIQDTCIFPNDFQLMRRVAWAETEFGLSIKDWTTPKGEGEIWGFADEVLLPNSITQELKSEISKKLSIDLDSISRTNGDWWVPMYSGLMTRVFIDGILKKSGSAVPRSLAGQAEFWNRNLDPKLSADVFEKKISGIPDACISQGADVLFILDSSGSIGGSDFAKAKNFIQSVVNSLKIGDDDFKVAVLEFATNVDEIIPFNSYSSSKNELLSKINRIRYTEGSTHMTAALQHAQQSFMASHGARETSEGFPKVAVLITDGEPNGAGSNSAEKALNAAIALRKQDVQVP